MRIGYVRVSTGDQNPVRQQVLVEELGAERVFADTAGGSGQNRPALRELLAFVREGDTVVVESISRFARNTRDLLELLEALAAKGAGFVSAKEAIDTATPAGRFMLTVFGAVAELERDYLLQRQREGIALAKAAGKYRGRKPIPLDPDRFRREVDRWRAGEITATEARRRLGLSSSTFYRRVKDLGVSPQTPPGEGTSGSFPWTPR